MSEQEIINRINILEQQLFLTQEYTEDFKKIMDYKGLEKFIDNVLEELHYLRKELVEIRNKK